MHAIQRAHLRLGPNPIDPQNDDDTSWLLYKERRIPEIAAEIFADRAKLELVLSNAINVDHVVAAIGGEKDDVEFWRWLVARIVAAVNARAEEQVDEAT